jgi:hypothetical protein
MSGVCCDPDLHRPVTLGTSRPARLYALFALAFLLVCLVSANAQKTNQETLRFVNSAVEQIRTNSNETEKTEKNAARATSGSRRHRRSMPAKRSRISSQMTELLILKERWQNDPTEENLAILTERITETACQDQVTANVKWKTTPRSGAILFYETLRARERGDRPRSLSNPTETVESVCIGRYYVWSERGGEATSDKNRPFDILRTTKQVTVVEDRVAAPTPTPTPAPTPTPTPSRPVLENK